LTTVIILLQAVSVAEISESASIEEVRERLTGRFMHLPPDQISAAVTDAFARFEHSKVRDFVPLLVERRASKELLGHKTASAYV
jgi:hypothetical protein